MSKKNNHGLNYTSGMLQSWNKFCFTGGIMEVNVSLPGTGTVSGLWPGVWTLGNLARAGHGATTDGIWPYSYDSCDIGVTANQSSTQASFLPGQRLNKCVCSGDHPNPGIGRGGPELDVLEGAASDGRFRNQGSVSQSAQIAPFDANLDVKASALTLQTGTIGKVGKTIINSYQGGVYQEAVSAVTGVDATFFGGLGFQTFAMEYLPTGQVPSQDGYVQWSVAGQNTFKINDSAIGPNPASQVSQRLISREPMSIVLNLGMSDSFSVADFANLVFPVVFHIDFVRIYQHPDRHSITCDPPDMPTSQYIQDHYNAYVNPNLTTWAQAGYSFPDYSLRNAGQC
ncbi:hypothetical protein BZG36_03729 [Bifiguratus adelaidae]|uniref:GH16 domain-containing protein n=1 Tax=Bifiguratus adelaidae TaxID=1938954 RepID=A0A261XZ36_9FUNG|nr:hypothetical protein BZG36_03729 [Bifiguratus adelaidae]